MKKIPAIVWLPLALVVGGLVGAYGPTEELRARGARAETAKAKAKERGNNAFGTFANLVNIPDEARRPRRRREPQTDRSAATTNAPAKSAVAPGASATNAVAAAATTNAPAANGPQRARRLAPEDLRARIDEASDLWRTRIEMARAAAVEKLGLDKNGADAFDAALADMNDRLRESMQAVADEVASAQSLTPELGVRLMGDVSAALAETYDAIGECADESRRSDVSNMNLADFIDPSVAEPLIAVQDKLEKPLR